MHQLGEFYSTEASIKPIRMNLKHSKVGRNDPCPCGSGLKYKKCCAEKAEAAPPSDLAEVYARKHRIRVKTPADIEAIRRAGRLVVATLDLVAPRLRPGLTTDEINTWVHEFTLQNGAVPAPLNYRGYPKSVCVSVNEVICHGIPGSRVLQDGDIVNVDVTSILDGYYADANKTYFVGTPRARRAQDRGGGARVPAPGDGRGDAGQHRRRHRLGHPVLRRGAGLLGGARVRRPRRRAWTSTSRPRSRISASRAPASP